MRYTPSVPPLPRAQDYLTRMNPLDRLATSFERFPGIGPRQAHRFVQFLLSQRDSARNELADAIRALGSSTALCPRCYCWFLKRDAEGRLCGICGDRARDSRTLLVVEKDADQDSVERGGYRGLYFVLGGTAPLGSEEPEKHVRIRELKARVQSDAKSGALAEVILGLSATTEGDHTRLLIHEELRPLAEAHSLTISTLGRGLSTGSELEYADPETIVQALSGRK